MSNFRILSKREIDAAKGRERQREIEEGKKLAGSVDMLRETRATEETKLAEYRIKALSAIQDEIDPKIAERDELNTEIRIKKAEREALIQPLTAKWDEVIAKEGEVKAKDESVQQAEAQLKLSIAANIQRERVNELERERAKDARERATQELIQSQKLHTEAQEINIEAKKKDAIMNAALALREETVAKREISAAEIARNAMAHERRNDIYEQRLFIREQQLKEGWKVLIEEQQNHGRHDTKRVTLKG